uniref:RNase H type-1 domain-containing protein n=1 Tax=Cannabis sativa TaxID=3483 RepID=A0A803PY80_CANSA
MGCLMLFGSSDYKMAEITEQPFRPREKLIEKQKYFQNVHKYTHLKGPMDKITSVAIPLALAGTSLYLIVGVGQFSSAATNFLDWFKEFLMRGRSSMLDELLMVGWSIWKARNELLWKDRTTAAAEVINSDFWIKPTAGMIKINVDGAIFEDITQFGTGLIARDCQGKIIEAFSTLHTGVCQPAIG